MSVPLLKCVLSPKKHLQLNRTKGKLITLIWERLVLLSIAKLSSGTWPGEAVFEKKKIKTVNTQNLQRTTTTKKPNDPKAMAQQQVWLPSASFLKSYLLRQLTQGNLSKRISKRSWALPALTPRTPGLAAEQRGASAPWQVGK